MFLLTCDVIDQCEVFHAQHFLNTDHMMKPKLTRPTIQIHCHVPCTTNTIWTQ